MMYNTPPRYEAHELSQELGEETAAKLARLALEAFENEDTADSCKPSGCIRAIELENAPDDTRVRLFRTANERGDRSTLSVGPTPKGTAVRTIHLDSPSGEMPHIPADGEIPKAILDFTLEELERRHTPTTDET